MKKYHFLSNLVGGVHGYKSILGKITVAVVVFLMVFSCLPNVQVTHADGTNKVVVTINYIDEIAAVTTGPGISTKFYMSTDNKNWEIVDTPSAIDLSAILSTKAVTIYFKGNKDPDVTTVLLPMEDNSLKATYIISGGSGYVVINPVIPVEYKKGVNGAWKMGSNQMPTAMYEIKGATLFFRTPAAANQRAGKVVTVKIGKRPTPPSVKIDGSKLGITGAKIGETQYRIGDNTNWTTFTSTNSTAKSIDLLTTLLPAATANTPIPVGSIEIRSMGTDKKLSSGVKLIDVSLQPIVPDAISVSGSTITVTDTNTKRLYEYTVVTKGLALNLETAKWTAIRVNTPVIVKNVAINDKVLVRLKSITDPITKQLVLASTYKEVTLTAISYK